MVTRKGQGFVLRADHERNDSRRRIGSPGAFNLPFFTKVMTSPIPPTIRYHYVTIPAMDVIEAGRLTIEPDSYIADEATGRAIQEILQKGYRWIRTDEGFAIFEKEFSIL